MRSSKNKTEFIKTRAISKKRQDLALVFFLLVVWYFPLFLHLDSFVIKIYDEARRAVNAFEMLNGDNFIVTTYQGQPDLWGTKPPFLIWAQALFMRLLGPSELAIRLPSALAGLGGASALLAFSWKFLKVKNVGIIASIIFLISNGALQSTHSLRSGDFDALLVFFTFSYLCAFFVFCETRKYKYLYLATVFIALAVLTKSIAGLLFMPALFIYAIRSRNLLQLFSSKHFYFSILVFLLMILSFYLGREHYNPGYLQAVWENELGGRYLDELEGHDHPFGYYFIRLWQYRFNGWIILSLIGILTGFLPQRKFTSFFPDRFVRFICFSSISIFVYLLVISNSSTKLVWYDLPVYPLLSVLAASGWVLILNILSVVTSYIGISLNQNKKSISGIFITLLLLAPFYAKQVQYCMRPDPADYNSPEAYGQFVKHLIKNNQLKGYYNIVSLYYRPNILFYTKVFNKDETNGFTLNPISPDHQLSPKSKAIICMQGEYERFKMKNEIKTVMSSKGNCYLVLVK